MSNDDLDRFKDLTFERFRRLALDETLSPHEKVGFPDSYREGIEPAIFADILGKLPNLERTGELIADIGPGCSGLPRMLIDICRRQSHTLFLIDSEEMLRLLPDEPFVIKIPAYYPRECGWLFSKHSEQFGAILSYSVLQYVYVEHNVFDFVDRSLSLLRHGGEMLIGDIPNVSKRKRFFSSPAGIECHHRFTGTTEDPDVRFNCPEAGDIDDAVIAALLLRCRSAGFDSYVLPQSDLLPIATRREDILIRRP